MVHIATLLYMADMSTQTMLVPAKTILPSLEFGAFSPNGKYVLLVCSDSRRYLMTTDQGRLKYAFGHFASFSLSNFPAATFHNVRFVSDDIVVYPKGSLDDSRDLEVFSITKGLALSVLKGHNYSIDLVCLSADGQLVGTATRDLTTINGVTEKFIHVWDLESVSLFSLCRGEGPYTAVTFAGTRREFLFSCSRWSNKVTTWYVGSKSNPCPEGIPLYQVIGHNDCVHYLLVTPGDGMIVTGSLDNTIKVRFVVITQHTIY